jgi:hypothetical protein
MDQIHDARGAMVLVTADVSLVLLMAAVFWRTALRYSCNLGA